MNRNINIKKIIFLLILILSLIAFSISIYFTLIHSSNANDTKIGIEAFPESYQPYLYELQKKYPEWSFTPIYTGLDWNYVIDNENKFGVNLVPKSYSDRWKNTTPGEYNIEVDAGWVDASRQAVEYAMDPRNFLNEVRIFQFEELSYDTSTGSIDGIEKILYGTEFYNRSVSYLDAWGNNISTNATYSSLIQKAAQTSNVSAYHLASRIRQEVGPFLSHSSISGNISGYEGLYNFYNIGATSSSEPMGAILNGLKYAKNGNGASTATQTKYLIPWNSKEISITGGSIFIGSSYINLGQDTVYLQKFHVVDNSGGPLFWHQYMTNVLAPYSESSTIYKGFANNNLLQNNISFSIPVYDNMPDIPTESPNINPSDFVNDNTEVFANVENTLNIRTQPTTSSEVITTVTKTDSLTRIKKGIQSGDLWDKVILENGIIGFAFSSYLTDLPDIQITDININLESTTLNVGESTQLDIQITPAEASDNKVVFSTSDSNILTIDQSGNILAINPGNATITVKAEENNISKSVDITVISKVTDLILNTSNLTLNINDSFKLEATIVPSNASNTNVTFNSSNEDIATIDSNGNILALANGKTDITCTTVDGNITKILPVFVTIELTTDELQFDETLKISNGQISGFNHNNMSISAIKTMITTDYNVHFSDHNGNVLSDDSKLGTGSKIQIYSNENVLLSEYTVILYGDVNGDGKIDSIDLLVLQRHILELEKLANSFLISGNISKNGKNPSSLDSLLIQRHILELQLISQ